MSGLEPTRDKVKGNLVWKKKEVCCIRCFWALHVFEDAFGGIVIKDENSGSGPPPNCYEVGDT